MSKTKPTDQLNKRAVIYCRVSTKEQVDEGNSLVTQERHCKEYAFKEGYEIAHVFIEQGESAKTTDRPQLQRLLDFCSNKKNKVTTVLTYKLDRISRNTDDYSQIRILLKRYGVEIKSITEYFENTPAGRFMENIIANVAQFDNDVRTERSVGGMRDAMREGRYVWSAPIGYDNVKIGGKSTIHPNEMAPLVQQAFKMVAKNTFSVEEVRRNMLDAGLMTKRGKKLTKSYFYKVLKNKVYMGQIVKFGEQHPGTYEALIPEHQFQQVQWVLKNRAKRSYLYLTEHPDFPLRRFVSHAETGKKLTGGWAKGRNKKFPYYYYSGKGKSFKRDFLNDKFAAYVNKFSLKGDKLEEFKEKLRENLTKEQSDALFKRKELEKSITMLNEKIAALIDKNFQGYINNEVLSRQLDLTQKQLHDAQAMLADIPNQLCDVDDMVDFTEEYLKNPGNCWLNANPSQKILLQWFKFPKGITFDGENFRTTEIINIFKVKRSFLNKKSPKVHSKTETLNHTSITGELPITVYYQIAKEINFLQSIFEDNKVV